MDRQEIYEICMSVDSFIADRLTESIVCGISYDMLEAQMALLDIQMVRFEEIFLPYIETQNGQTIFERLEDKQFFLETVN